MFHDVTPFDVTEDNAIEHALARANLTEAPPTVLVWEVLRSHIKTLSNLGFFVLESATAYGESGGPVKLDPPRAFMPPWIAAIYIGWRPNRTIAVEVIRLITEHKLVAEVETIVALAVPGLEYEAVAPYLIALGLARSFDGGETAIPVTYTMLDCTR